VHRVAGIETGWGWVRAEWTSGVRPAGAGDDERWLAGHSHFWVEDGLIRRHRSAARRLEAPPAGPPRPEARTYPTRPVVGVGGVILTPEGRVVLVKRANEPLAGQWSLPGGLLELGETLEAGTAREMLEETGLVVDVGPVVDVFDRILLDDEGRIRYHFVLVDCLCRPRAGTLAAGTDVADVRLADPDDLGRFVVTEKVRAVVAGALAVNRGHTW
jgi:ADP-ribose pyrophosphatase YjhB (NUDIX family)